MVALARSGELFADPQFSDVPAGLRTIRDIAFSGDGEPTTCPVFWQSVELAAEVKRAAGLQDAKLVLITDACYLTRPEVARALEVLDANQGEIWAKLDAGTEAYYRAVNRPNVPLRHVLDNITAAARVRPLVIQALFLRLHGQPPPAEEIVAFCDRLNEVVQAGGQLSYVQVYTVARRTTEAYATALSHAEVDAIAATVRQRTGLRAEAYYGAGE